MAVENADQKVFWERFAEHWVGQQADLDGLMQPVLDGVLQRADLQPAQRVLDVGCGTGTSSLRAGEAVGPGGSVTGVDISEPMLKRARQVGSHRSNVAFVTADVADHAFTPGEFDRVISRFGVMFFVDPLAAFRNVRKSMKPGARLSMACWSALDANPWFRIPMYAAKDRLGAPPPVDPDAPGPLAFRNIDRVRGILDGAGFTAIDATAEDLFLTPPGDLDHVSRHAAMIGPAARAIEFFEATEDDFEAIVAGVKGSFSAFMEPDGARVPARINFFTATVA
ncbi:MAG: class I SAM-dependent methyltransferase [Pseudomonadota bacterium]